MKRKDICEKCEAYNECADNNWHLFDPYNKECPNYNEGIKILKFFGSIYELNNNNKKD